MTIAGTRRKIQNQDRLVLTFRGLGGYWGKNHGQGPGRRIGESKGYYGGDGLGLVIAILLILLLLGKL